MKKREICELMALSYVLAHNKKLEEIMTKEQFDIMMDTIKDWFNNDEDKALQYIIDRTNKLMGELTKHLEVPNKVEKESEV